MPSEHHARKNLAVIKYNTKMVVSRYPSEERGEETEERDSNCKSDKS
jgi:hypothetical protein